MTRHIALGNGSLLVNIDKWLQVRDFYYPHVGEENHLAGHAQLKDKLKKRLLSEFKKGKVIRGGITFSKDRIVSDEGIELKGDKILDFIEDNRIITTEAEFANKGVHYCALCDGVIYQNKIVAVVGGGDSSAKEALLMSQYASKVYSLVRGEKLRGEPINNDRVAKNPKIEVVTKVNIKQIIGNKIVKGVILDKPINGSTTLNLDAVFVAIGHVALSQLAKDIGVATNEKGEIIIDRQSKTNVPGFFAAGDVCDTVFKQAITGVSEAVTAVYSAYTYVNENEFICPIGNEDLVMKTHKNS